MEINRCPSPVLGHHLHRPKFWTKFWTKFPQTSFNACEDICDVLNAHKRLALYCQSDHNLTPRSLDWVWTRWPSACPRSMSTPDTGSPSPWPASLRLAHSLSSDPRYPDSAWGSHSSSVWRSLVSSLLRNLRPLYLEETISYYHYHANLSRQNIWVKLQYNSKSAVVNIVQFIMHLK